MSEERSSGGIGAEFTDLLNCALDELERGTRRPIVITGPIGAGKTGLARRLAESLKERGLRVGGIVAERSMERGETVGYTLVDLSSGKERRFASSTPPGIPVGRFFISDEGLAFAKEALAKAEGMDVAFLDEVGRMELSGEGHAGPLRRLLSSESLLVMTVRDSFLKLAIERFSLDRPLLFPIGPAAPLERGADRAVG